MISNPKHGWCDIKIGEFQGTGSYLTAVPLDMVNAFIHYYEDGAGACFVNEEGTDFTLVLSEFNAYIIINREKQELYNVSVSIDTLADELQDDILKCPKEWTKEFMTSEFDGDATSLSYQNGEINRRTLYLLKQVDTLRNIRERQRAYTSTQKEEDKIEYE